VQEFVDEHRALILRHARRHVRGTGEKIPAEDVAREIELELTQLALHGLAPVSIDSPDGYIRAIVKHAAGRAKRRRTLIAQLAAGDDLDALSNDLAALDADLPPRPTPPSAPEREARAAIDRVKDALTPTDALVFAFLVEDDESTLDVAAAMGVPVDDVVAARARIVGVAAAQGIEPDPDERSERHEPEGA
jgi:DNA-directed RNA polymerase specialized sigma24 family protein